MECLKYVLDRMSPLIPTSSFRKYFSNSSTVFCRPFRVLVDPSYSICAGGTVARQRTYGPPPQIPGLPAPLPPTWKCIEGRFVIVHASYQSYLGEDCLFAPETRLDDGKIWLLIVKAGTSRSQLLHFLLGLSTEAHATTTQNPEEIQLFPVNAFRIEPDMTEHGYMTVDGEHVEYGDIVNPGAVTRQV